MAVGGFSILCVIVIAVFGLVGEGVRDLRAQVVASVTTLVAAIAGFYFGAQTAGSTADATKPLAPSPPQLHAGAEEPHFKVGQSSNWVPGLTGSPPPVVKLGGVDALPDGLELDPTTGAIAGTPTAVGTTPITLIATNGVTPEAKLTITLVVD
ncbi:MAG: Ig domain-containing protein [Humibacillus sp.]|nr:Ig domain-containing protein [Humibacillus sp.]MDN5780199.1 Ig domain-containing protein [Humibacillus sp.]